MTNKLPVVGKRYKHKIVDITLKISKIENDKIYVENYTTEFDKFLKEFEELPEDKPTCKETLQVEDECPSEVAADEWNTTEIKEETKPETQSHVSELSPEVKEVIEELDKELSAKRECHFTRIEKLENLSQNLLNALDKQFNKKSDSMANPTIPKKAISGITDHTIEKSTWKSLAEITLDERKENSYFFVRKKSKIYGDLVHFCELKNIPSLLRSGYTEYCEVYDFVREYYKEENDK